MIGDRDGRQGLDPGIVGDQARPVRAFAAAANRRPGGRGRPPGPGVAEPQLGKDVNRRGDRPAIERLDADHKVFGRVLGILDHDIKVSVLIENAGVEELELRPLPVSRFVFIDQAAIGIFALGIFVQIFHVGVRWEVVEVVVILLDVLTVVSFVRREPEESLLENRVAAVPECRGEAEDLVAIANAGDAVFSPAVGLAARQVVAEEIPGVTVSAIVFAHGRPRPLGEVWAPASPRSDVVADLGESCVFGGSGMHSIHR